MGPTWGPSGADMTQVGPMLAPWTLHMMIDRLCDTVFRAARNWFSLFKTQISLSLIGHLMPTWAALYMGTYIQVEMYRRILLIFWHLYILLLYCSLAVTIMSSGNVRFPNYQLNVQIINIFYSMCGIIQQSNWVFRWNINNYPITCFVLNGLNFKLRWPVWKNTINNV